jgi:hypothetical protein
LASTLAGCIRAPALPPGLAVPDPAKVAECARLRSKHNSLATAAAIVGPLGGVGGLAGDVPTTEEKVLIAGAGVGLAVAATILGVFAGLANDDYAQEQCSSVPEPP